MLNAFIKLHEQSKWEYKDHHIICLFQSTWGDTAIGKCIISIINDIDNITLACHGSISSCWFDIFFYAKCKKEVAPICRGMCHIWWFETTINHRVIKKPWGAQEAFLQDVKRGSKNNAKFYKKMGMKKWDIKHFKHDYDVCFNSKQLKRFVKNQQNSGYISK